MIQRAHGRQGEYSGPEYSVERNTVSGINGLLEALSRVSALKERWSSYFDRETLLCLRRTKRKTQTNAISSQMKASHIHHDMVAHFSNQIAVEHESIFKPINARVGGGKEEVVPSVNLRSNLTRMAVLYH